MEGCKKLKWGEVSFQICKIFWEKTEQKISDLHALLIQIMLFFNPYETRMSKECVFFCRSKTRKIRKVVQELRKPEELLAQTASQPKTNNSCETETSV